VEALRNRQVKNFLAVTMLAPGIPMLLMGDEIRRTQGGNNNAWCQDNEIAWMDWRRLERHRDVFRFVRRLARLRASILPGRTTPLTLSEFLRRSRIQWNGIRLGEPDWSADSHSIAASLQDVEGTALAHVIVSAWHEPLHFELPPVESGWRQMVDTYLPAPHDIHRWEEAPVIETRSYLVGAHSLAFLAAEAPAR
jgi:glycogen operon protein